MNAQIEIKEYTTGREEQRQNSANRNLTNKVIRINNNIEQVYMNIAYKANRSDKQRNERRAKR